MLFGNSFNFSLKDTVQLVACCWPYIQIPQMFLVLEAILASFYLIGPGTYTGYLYDSDVSNGQRANSIQAKATLERCPGCSAIGPEALLGRRNAFLVFGPWGLRLSRKASTVGTEWVQFKHWQQWQLFALSSCSLVAAVLEIAVNIFPLTRV